jgi:nucleotide-binding universal stress UspA family protein
MRVLFATDGFKPARVGEELILGLFDRAKVSIDVLAVEPDPIDEVLPIDTYLEMKKLNMDVLGAEGVAREAAGHLAEAGFTTSRSMRKGDPVDEIIAAATEGAHDLIVVGASHDSWLGNTLLGSVSTHVLHSTPTSILLAHRPPNGPGRVLFGDDGSSDSMRAINLAVRVLDPKRCSAEVVTVIHHPQTLLPLYPPGAWPGAAPYSDDTEQERIKSARRMVQRSSRPLKDAGFEVEEVILVGSPTSQLLKEADRIGADLVVVGSRGSGPIRRTLLGSVGEQMARHAPAALVARRPHR